MSVQAPAPPGQRLHDCAQKPCIQDWSHFPQEACCWQVKSLEGATSVQTAGVGAGSAFPAVYVHEAASVPCRRQDAGSCQADRCKNISS